MTAEQLQHARASAWRHDGRGLLTGDDASAWLRDTGLALFLPRPAQIAAPAGSFAEAVLGRADPTPSPRTIEAAAELLHRMLASSSGQGQAPAALNLLGTPGDQPDFLITEETLPFLFALRGDREWTRGPRGKSSPLVVEVWKLLQRDGAQTADELKNKLGRHLTESAALRALTELWATLRIEPVYTPVGEAEEATRWQLLEARREQAMAAGSAMAQGMALSALVSVYLQSAVAATGDEIEAFLSPLASRSRVRDAVRGLHATRQLGVRHLGANEHFFVEGSLPDFSVDLGVDFREALPRELADMLPEVPAPADLVVGDAAGASESGLRIDALSDAETERERTVGEGRKRFVAGRAAGAEERRSFGPAVRGGKSLGGPRKTFAGKGAGARRSDGAPGRSFGERGPSRPAAGPREGARSSPGASAGSGSGPGTRSGREDGAGKPFFAREPWKEDRKEGSGPARPVRPASEQGGSGGGRGNARPERPGAGRSAASAGEQRPFSGAPASSFRAGGFRAPTFRKDGERKPFAPRGEQRGPRETGPAEEGGAQPPRKPFAPRGDGDRRPFPPREGSRPFASPVSSPGGDRKPFAARDGSRPNPGDRKPFTPREGSRPFPPGGDGQPFASRDGGRPFAPRGDRKPFAPREGDTGERKPFAPRGDRKPFAPREGGAPGRRTFAPRAGAPDGQGERRPFAPRDRDDSPRRSGAEGSAPPRRFAGGEGRPSRPGAPAGPARPGGKRPRTSPFTSSGKPRAGVGATGRPGPRSGSGPGSGPEGRAGRPGKPASGRKPGAPPRKPGAKGPGTKGSGTKGSGTKGSGKGPRRDG